MTACIVHPIHSQTLGNIGLKALREILDRLVVPFGKCFTVYTSRALVRKAGFLNQNFQFAVVTTHNFNR